MLNVVARTIAIVVITGLYATALVADEKLQTGESETLAAKLAQIPKNKSILFLNQEQRALVFRHLDLLAPANRVKAGSTPRKLAAGAPLDLSWQWRDADQSVSQYMQAQQTAGIMILHAGKLRLERYELGFDAEQRWTSFSVAKSITSTLLGIALRDGDIKSLDDLLSVYIPELKGSGYASVTVRQLLTMQTGVAWNEDYSDPESDVAKFSVEPVVDGQDPTVSYMMRMPTDVAAGSRWQYNTGETNLLGVLVSRATGKDLSSYLSEKIWQPYGMEADAAWLLNAGAREIAGCCFSARLSDFARFGLFVLNDGKIDGKSLVPEDWFTSAGRKQADIGRPGFGYGYQWWTYDDGSFAAQGIFGQGIFIDPRRQLVIASNGNWPSASSDELKSQRNAFYRAVQTAIDKEITD